jgi:hypothetical protein
MVNAKFQITKVSLKKIVKWYAILQQYAKELICTRSFLKNWKEFCSNLRICNGIALYHNQV